MSLILRIFLLFAGVSMLVFLAGGLITYRAMEREINIEQQRFLVERLEQVKSFIERRQPKDSVRWSQVLIVPLKENAPEQTLYSDTLVMHNYLQRLEPHIKITAVRTVRDKSYYISIYDLIIESDDIAEAVTTSLVKTYLILLAVILPLGFLASYYLLKPFRQTLASIRRFSLQKEQTGEVFRKSSIPEFKKLNGFLEEMTAKARHDYAVLKEFSENASHELQTPLAIIQAKLEVLMDSPLSEEQFEQISQVQQTLRRLSNLSHSLGLLTKIENREFSKLEEIDLSELVNKMLLEFSELIELKKLTLSSTIDKNVSLKADRTLTELLITNLIINAIRHNHENGFIEVQLKSGMLKVMNSGSDLPMKPEELFERFKKSNQSAKSSGLGLAIVKRICELYRFAISYEQHNGKHTLQVTF